MEGTQVDVEGFVKVKKHLVAQVENITLTIDTVADVIYIEQPGDNPEPETVMVFGKDTAEDMIKLLQAWVDAW